MPEPPFAPRLVSDMLRQLDKTVRAHLLYLNNHNNPNYVRALEQARESFVALWEETDDVTLHVTDTALVWQGRKVLDEPTKAQDSLPWVLFKDGVRELTLQKGFEEKELDIFLYLIAKVRHALPNQDDLVTLLWEQEFTTLWYRYADFADDLAPLAASPDRRGTYPTSGGEAPNLAAAIREAVQETSPSGTSGGALVEAERLGIVRMDDYDSTLYFLDAAEIEYLVNYHLVVDALDRDAALGAALDGVLDQHVRGIGDQDGARGNPGARRQRLGHLAERGVLGGEAIGDQAVLVLEAGEPGLHRAHGRQHLVVLGVVLEAGAVLLGRDAHAGLELTLLGGHQVGEDRGVVSDGRDAGHHLAAPQTMFSRTSNRSFVAWIMRAEALKAC